jgi:spore photoproduct lyase
MSYKDSAPEKWEYRKHTRVKHELLRKYLYAWIIKLGSFHRRILFFDGFAGRGEYYNTGEVIALGSPIIALQVANDLLEHCEEKMRKPYFDEFICFAIEKDEDNFKNLQKVLAREKEKIKFKDKLLIKPINNEFANVTNKILEEVGENIAPSFFFIDPFGFSGVPFETVKSILSLPRAEIFFTFMTQSINRFLALPNVEKALDELYPTSEWRQILNRSEKRDQALKDLYIKCLHEIAGVKYTWAFSVSMDKKYHTLYYLIHATNNIDGHKIMKGIMSNQSAHGSFAYLGPNDVSERSQTRLFDIQDTGQLKKYLLERFRDETLTYDNIQEKVCHPWYSEPPYIDKHFRQALKDLEKEHKIEVERVTSRTERGLSGNDRVSFPANKSLQTSLSVSIPKPVSSIKIHYKDYQLLDGRKEPLVQRVNDGSIITRFDKTPLPMRQTDVVCPHFLELKWAYGCPYDCAWCYLKGTFRFRPEGKSPVIKPYEKTERHTRKFLEEVKTPEILNTGEIADSLMYENVERPFSKLILPIFETQELHKVLFLTKSSNVTNLLEIEPHNQAIISFSLNAMPVAKRWEKAPSVLKRIEAARKVIDAGYEVRIRIDPLIPIENWQDHYSQLLDIIFENFTPERITLGSLRGLQSTINGCTDKSWVEYLKESSNWGKKIDFETRYAMYSIIVQQLKTDYGFDNIALCKETPQMWNALGMDYHKIRCNCVW